MEPINNQPEPRYWEKMRLVADLLRASEAPIVIIAHEDPDGDAVGSTLGLARALWQLGKNVYWIVEPPRFLRFLPRDEEYHEPLEKLPEDAILVVVDSGDRHRAVGAPVEGFVINIDHHGSNSRFGQIHIVDPGKAAAAQMIKDLIDALEVEWNEEIATPVLTGLITDTGNFRFGNTTPEVLETAAELVAHGVKLAELTDRLQWRPPQYFKLMGLVLQTVRFHFGGLAVTAHVTRQMTEEAGSGEEDSDDFVGVIRYAEGSYVAVFLKEREGATKVSIRSRAGVSAQNIAVELGGGGHVPAAGATLEGLSIEEAYPVVLAAVEKELRRAGLL
ncbi:DHH family phosphoesterase [Oceanithermus sp.]